MKQYSDFSKIIHREGYIFIVSFAVVTFLLFTVHNSFGYVGLVITIWCIYFFRNPDRFTPISDDLVVSPADGTVQKITEAIPPLELGLGNQEMIRVSIFLNM